MACVHFAGGCLCGVGNPVYTISVSGRRFAFEMHSYFGPTRINRRTGEVLHDLPEGHAYWLAIQLWIEQGKRHKDGDCIWVMKPKARVEKRGRRWWILENVTWSPEQQKYLVTPCDSERQIVEELTADK